MKEGTGDIIPPLQERMVVLPTGERRLPDALTREEWDRILTLFCEASGTNFFSDGFLRFIHRLNEQEERFGTLIPIDAMFRDPRHNPYVAMFDTDDDACLKLMQISADFTSYLVALDAFRAQNHREPNRHERDILENEPGFIIQIAGYKRDVMKAVEAEFLKNGYPVWGHMGPLKSPL